MEASFLLHHGEDKITFAELPKDCRDWKLAKYQKEGKHFGQLFLHSPSQGAKPVWVFKLKFLDLPDEKETRLKEKMKQENAQGKVSEEKTDAQKIKDEVKAEEKKALEEDKERKASEAEAAAKEKALKEANDEKQRKAAEAEVAAQKKAMEDEVRAQVEQKLRDEIRQQMEEEVKAKIQKEVDAAAAEMNSKKSEDENEELKQRQEKQKEELEKKKREEEELEKKKREEEELMSKQSQEKEMQEIERKKREEEEEKKRQAAIIQANKESALKRKGAAKEEPEPRSAKKVKVPPWGHFGQGVGKVCSCVGFNNSPRNGWVRVSCIFISDLWQELY